MTISEREKYGICKGFTDNQRAAAERQGNIVVSAGAGSGKTTVMIARIINKILDGEKPESMLIVTFTRASAADMRIKLSKKLAELKAESRARGDAGVFECVREAIESLSVCNLGTLHGYCQKLIKRYYGVANIDPAATIGEDGEIKLIMNNAVSDAVADRLELERGDDCSGEKYFTEMYELLTSRKNGDGAIAAVKAIIDFALSLPHPDEFLDRKSSDSDRFKELDEIFEAEVCALAAPIKELKNDLIAAKMDKHAAVIDEFIDYARGIIEKPTATSHRQKFDATDELNERFKALKKRCGECRDFKLLCDELKTVNSAPYANALLDVAKNALDIFDGVKKRQGKLDYSDLEHGAFRIISDEACMNEIMSTVKYVFIDEFQDVSPLQHAFMQTFKARGAEVFIVGDVKQSIYGFRRCSPDHFKREIDGAECAGDKERAGGNGFIHIPLTDNFRSSGAVIDFINGIFDRAMTEEFGGADYKGRDRLVCGTEQKTESFTAADGNEVILPTGARAELVVLPAESEERIVDTAYSVVDAAKAEQRSDAEAEFIADAIEQYIGFSIKRRQAIDEHTESCDPPIELGDIAVLMRSMNERFCQELAREFDKRGIRYNFGKKSSVKSYASAVALIDILRCVDNGFDDIALYTALRSPMGGFSDAELAEIAAAGGNIIARRLLASGEFKSKRSQIRFWQKAGEYKGAYSDRLDAFFALKREISEFSKKHDCGDTLGFITSKIDYFQHCYETGGDARAVEAVIEYASDKRCDVHTFLEYYDSADFDLELDSGSDAVNITTVHSSKGLEYEFVIVADTAREFNKNDLRKKFLISENGVAVKIPDMENGKVVNTAPYEAEKLAAPDRLKQEELRLFYVALTRARNKLIVCGKQKKKECDSAEAAVCPLDFALLGAKSVAPETAIENIARDAAECEKYITEKATEQIENAALDPKITEAVAARIGFVPVYNKRVPIKACVTALAHEDDSDDYTFGAEVITADDRNGGKIKPNDLGGVDVRLRGTAYHRAMELIDFDDPDFDGLGDKCENFKLVDAEKIKLAVDVMKSITKGKRYFKERYFIVDMPREVDGENILVQGIIDLMILGEDGVTLIDYKTGDPKTLLNDGYITQLKLYARAVEKSTAGKYAVKNAYLYSFESGELIPVIL